jgi:hypothetical protein
MIFKVVPGVVGASYSLCQVIGVVKVGRGEVPVRGLRAREMYCAEALSAPGKISSRAPIRLSSLQNVPAKCTIVLQPPTSPTTKAYDSPRLQLYI